MANESDKHRLFFALCPPPATQAAITAFLRNNPAPGKPVPAANRHITLLFLGHVDHATCQRLQTAHIPDLPPAFSIHLTRYGWWPRPQVGYLAPAPAPPALLRLQQSVCEAAKSSGLSIKPSAYRPHATVWKKLASPWKGRQTPAIDWPVTEVHLLRSFLSPRGPHYRSLTRWPLLPQNKN